MWQALKEKTRESIRLFIISTELYKSPMHLLTLIVTVGGVVWSVYNYVEDLKLRIAILIIISLLFYLFIDNIISLMFPLSRWAKIIVDTYGTNPEIVSYIAKNIKNWLENIIDFINKQPDMKVVINYVKTDNIDSLKRLSELFLDSSSINRLIKKDGDYLNALISGACDSFRINQEPIEELINTKIDVDQKIGTEIISLYNQIQININKFIVEDDFEKRDDYRDKIIDIATDILNKEKRLNNQIDWLVELDKRKSDIPFLIEIIKESSTGNALVKLSRLLSKGNNKLEDLFWLIQFANSRKGYKISELLGFKIDEDINSSNRVLKWYGREIIGEFDQEKRFLNEFDWLRRKALTNLWNEFKKWNDSKRKLDFSGSIAIGLTYGYSAALRTILKERCKKGGNISGLHIILIQSSEAPGDEEVLKAELMADYKDQGLKCDIMPIEAIQKKEMQLQMNSIFVGLESINKHGDIVHPRGGSEIIREIKKVNPNIEVYAFGESYKVLDFNDKDIDYTKLSLFRSENINYVVTDHGVHERKEVRLFDWNDLPGNDNNRLIDFLKKSFGLTRVTPKIEKTEDGRSFYISFDNISILLGHNNEKNRATTRTNYVVTGDLYLFSWDGVPGKDNSRLLKLLNVDFEIDLMEKTRFKKTDDNRTISISNEEKLVEIMLDDKNKEKAKLKIGNDRTYNLQVKEENGHLNIYDKFIVKIENGKLIIYKEKWEINGKIEPDLGCCSKHWEEVLSNRYKI